MNVADRLRPATILEWELATHRCRTPTEILYPSQVYSQQWKVFQQLVSETRVLPSFSFSRLRDRIVVHQHYIAIASASELEKENVD